MRIGVYGALGFAQGMSVGYDNYFLKNLSGPCTFAWTQEKKMPLCSLQKSSEPPVHGAD